jgi:hypothetical protein
MGEEVGGFFASLKLMTDEGSFQRGTGHLKSLSDKLSGLVMWAAGLIGIAEGIKAVVAAAAEAQNIAFSAERFGISFKSIKEWEAAWAETGGTIKDVTTMMEQLQRKQVEIFKQGKGSMDWQAISMLGLDPGATARQAAPQMAASIIAAAESKIRGGADRGAMLKVVDDLLGASASKQVEYDVAHGTSLGERMARMGGSVFETKADAYAGGSGVKEFMDLKTILANIGQAFSSKAMGAMADTLRNFNDWLLSHNDLIVRLVDNLAALVKALAEWTSGVLEDLVGSKNVGDFVSRRSKRAETADVAAMDAAINAMGGKRVTAETSVKELINDPRYRQVMANFIRTGSYGAAASPDKPMSIDLSIDGKLYDQSGKVVGELSKQNSRMAVQQ